MTYGWLLERRAFFSSSEGRSNRTSWRELSHLAYVSFARLVCRMATGVTTQDGIEDFSSQESRANAAPKPLRDRLALWTLPQLTAVLKINDVKMSGNKPEVIERIAVCVERGVPPICATCKRKRLKWKNDVDSFHCPGYYDPVLGQPVRCGGTRGKTTELVGWQWGPAGEPSGVRQPKGSARSPTQAVPPEGPTDVPAAANSTTDSVMSPPRTSSLEVAPELTAAPAAANSTTDSAMSPPPGSPLERLPELVRSGAPFKFPHRVSDVEVEELEKGVARRFNDVSSGLQRAAAKLLLWYARADYLWFHAITQRSRREVSSYEFEISVFRINQLL